MYVPAGRYTSGPIELFSNMILDIDAGATIEFPVASLPCTKGRYLGVEAVTPMPLIGGHDVENVTSRGAASLPRPTTKPGAKPIRAPMKST